MKQNKSYQLSFYLAPMSMAAYTPNKIYHTLLTTVDLILFLLKSVGRDLGSLVSSLWHSAIYSAGCAQGNVHPITQKQLGRTILFNVASALWLLLARHWQEKCKGTATLLPAIHDAEVTTLILTLAQKRKRTWSLGFCQGISDSYEKLGRNHAKKRTGGVYQHISYVVHISCQTISCFCFASVHWRHWRPLISILPIYFLLWSETRTRNPKALKMIGPARV